MSKKLKGCRSTKECDRDYGNVCAQLGDVVGGIAALHGQKQKLLKRQAEIRLEREYAEQQEAAIKAQTPDVPETSVEPQLESAG